MSYEQDLEKRIEDQSAIIDKMADEIKELIDKNKWVYLLETKMTDPSGIEQFNSIPFCDLEALYEVLASKVDYYRNGTVFSYVDFTAIKSDWGDIMTSESRFLTCDFILDIGIISNKEIKYNTDNEWTDAFKEVLNKLNL